MDPVTENPAVGATEVWEFYNATADAHPMHIHEVAFEVVEPAGTSVNEEARSSSRSNSAGPHPARVLENGLKDTVIAYPGQVTRLRLRFNNPGQFVWHCHIVEHEDNEMMRPYRIGPVQPGQPGCRWIAGLSAPGCEVARKLATALQRHPGKIAACGDEDRSRRCLVRSRAQRGVGCFYRRPVVKR